MILYPITITICWLFTLTITGVYWICKIYLFLAVELMFTVLLLKSGKITIIGLLLCLSVEDILLVSYRTWKI